MSFLRGRGEGIKISADMLHICRFVSGFGPSYTDILVDISGYNPIYGRITDTNIVTNTKVLRLHHLLVEHSSYELL